jgi:hypothetical protein
MRKTLVLLAAALPAFGAPGFDFKQIDKLGANAKDSTNITLEGPMLKMVSGLIPGDKDSASVKAMIDGLKGVYIRTYEFDEAGKYNEADLDPLRTYLDAQHWTKVVDVKEKNESSAIYLLATPDNKPAGLAIIDVEPKEVTVVFIEGAINLNDIGKLGGNLGIPDMSILTDGKNEPKAQKKTTKDEDQ